ncbi:MAG: DNA polymerase I [Bacteroidaceae bacterium]|nr:DNA polymerase I [Bacteroidaceae bacterium]
MKLFLLDGYALIYRAYYAFINSPRINSKGQNTSAVLGFVNTLEEILRKQQPSHIGVAFDPHGGTFRHKAFPSYKAQREQTPEAITFAVPIIKQILEAYRIPILEVAGYEADDVIGTLAHQADEQGIETVMITPDKDYGQLVTERVTMLRPPVGKSDWTQMGPHEVCEKWGIENPRQVIDILGLMGDSSDNIPGCPGVGEKTATNLIQQFGGVEGLLQRTDELKGAIQKKVTENEQQIRDSYWLATIALDVPITLDMNLLERKDVNENALREIYESMEFGFLLKKIKAGSAETGSAPKAKKKATDSAQLDLFDDFNPQDNTAAPAEPMEELVENGEEVIGHDLKSIFRKNGQAWPEKPCFDTMLAHYLLHPEMTHNLSAISQGENLTTLRQRLERELREENLWDLFQTVEMPLAPVLLEMERVGARIDTEGLKETSRLYTERMNALEEEIHQLSGVPGFNIASPRQVGEVLFDRLHLSDKPKKTKTGQYVTSEEILESLRGSHPIVEKILQHRSLKKLLGTYIDALPLLINKETGHIHTTFNQAVTATGRLSSSNPNLQNIPVRDAEGKEVRKAFIPDEGELFFSADYSQIELRIMAHLSGDQNLIDAFLSGQDIHAATAAKIFHKKIEEVTSDERRSAKTANFGIIYGISAFGLAQRIGCSRSEAKSLIDGYFLTYPKVREYMDESIRLCRERLYAETIFHRRCHLPDIMSGNAVVRGYAERNAINAPIQGSAADIIKVAMIRVARRMKQEGVKSRMILQVHDELNFSVPRDEQELMQRLVLEEMQAAVTLRVPLIADAGWGSNWLEAH